MVLAEWYTLLACDQKVLGSSASDTIIANQPPSLLDDSSHNKKRPHKPQLRSWLLKTEFTD